MTTPDHERARTAARLAPAPAFVALYALAVGTAPGRRLDADALEALSTGRLEGVGQAVTHVLNPLTFSLVAIALVVAARGRSPAAAVLVALLLGATNASAWLLETVLGWLDPLGGEHRRALGPAYFPSGHATAAMSLVLAGVVVSPVRYRRAVAVASGAFAVLFGTAVVAGGSHTPSDVLGAFLLVAAWAALAPPRLAVQRPRSGGQAGMSLVERRVDGLDVGVGRE